MLMRNQSKSLKFSVTEFEIKRRMDTSPISDRTKPVEIHENYHTWFISSKSGLKPHIYKVTFNKLGITETRFVILLVNKLSVIVYILIKQDTGNRIITYINIDSINVITVVLVSNGQIWSIHFIYNNIKQLIFTLLSLSPSLCACVCVCVCVCVHVFQKIVIQRTVYISSNFIVTLHLCHLMQEFLQSSNNL